MLLEEKSMLELMGMAAGDLNLVFPGSGRSGKSNRSLLLSFSSPPSMSPPWNGRDGSRPVSGNSQWSRSEPDAKILLVDEEGHLTWEAVVDGAPLA